MLGEAMDGGKRSEFLLRGLDDIDVVRRAMRRSGIGSKPIADTAVGVGSRYLMDEFTPSGRSVKYRFRMTSRLA
jgi:hypothetical protein